MRAVANIFSLSQTLPQMLSSFLLCFNLWMLKFWIYSKISVVWFSIFLCAKKKVKSANSLNETFLKERRLEYHPKYIELDSYRFLLILQWTNKDQLAIVASWEAY